MKNFLKNCLATCIDLSVVLALSFWLIVLIDNALGTNVQSLIFNPELLEKSGKNALLTILTVFSFYLLISISLRSSVGQILKHKPQRRKFWRLVYVKMLDFYVIFTVSLLLNYILQKFIWFEYFNLLIFCYLAYGLISVFCKGMTIGHYVFGVKMRYQREMSKKDFLIYFLLKITCLIIIPYAICWLFGIVDSYAIFVNLLFFNLIIRLLCGLRFRKTLNLKIFRAKMEFVEQTKIRKFLNFVGVLIVMFSSLTALQSMNNRIHDSAEKVFGFNFPYEFPKHPNMAKVAPYAEFLKQQHQSPKDYVLSLFERYDIVILQEKYHGESTQWELFEEIVADSSFIQNVGHVFTEYGSAMHQRKIDDFLTKTFENEEVLEQETAVLMYYMSGGFYYFIKTLNQLNSTLPDSLKIREHYTDCIDWDHFSTFGRADVGELNRDSLMADVVIRWYESQKAENQRHKCLVITNSRHAFGYAGGVDKVKRCKPFRMLTLGNQAQYIWEQFPEQTATVMQPDNNPNRTLYLPFYKASHKGIWDEAFRVNDYKSVGFDLKNTPFGDDHFEMYCLKGGKTDLTYADLFTGLIFNKSYTKMQQKQHPFRKFAVEEEARRKGITDTLLIQRKTLYLDNQAYTSDGIFGAMDIYGANMVPLILFWAWSILLIIIALLRIFRSNKTT